MVAPRMTHLRTLGMFLMAFTMTTIPACSNPPPAESSLPVPAGALAVMRAAGGVTLDGKLDEPAWQTAPASEVFVPSINRAEKELAEDPAYRTTVRALHDGSTLYVAFECHGPPFWATFTRRDDKLYEQDVAEIFLDVAGDMREYAEMQASPNGVVADFYHWWNPPPTYPAGQLDWDQIGKQHRGDGAWNLDGLRAAGRAMDAPAQGWTVEFAVPLEPLLTVRGLPPTLSPGQTLKANFVRYVWLLKPDGTRGHNQMTWKPIIQGCPHVSPMAHGTLFVAE